MVNRGFWKWRIFMFGLVTVLAFANLIVSALMATSVAQIPYAYLVSCVLAIFTSTLAFVIFPSMLALSLERKLVEKVDITPLFDFLCTATSMILFLVTGCLMQSSLWTWVCDTAPERASSSSGYSIPRLSPPDVQLSHSDFEFTKEPRGGLTGKAVTIILGVLRSQCDKAQLIEALSFSIATLLFLYAVMLISRTQCHKRVGFKRIWTSDIRILLYPPPKQTPSLRMEEVKEAFPGVPTSPISPTYMNRSFQSWHGSAQGSELKNWNGFAPASPNGDARGVDIEKAKAGKAVLDYNKERKDILHWQAQLHT